MTARLSRIALALLLASATAVPAAMAEDDAQAGAVAASGIDAAQAPINRPDPEVIPPPADQAFIYPSTRRDEAQVETIFGQRIADPYRWLENDVRSDPEVAAWVEAQNRTTQDYLATAVPGREVMAARIRKLINYERFSLPRRAGQRYFYTRNDGLQNQSVLYVRDGLNGTPRELINPNQWAQDGATALDAWVPSQNGGLLAYSVQDGGTDWRIIRVLDVATGQQTTDEIRWAKFTGIAWVGNEGFLYSRFPEPAEGQDFQSLNFNQAVYYHRIGTPQSADQLVYSTPDDRTLGHGAEVTHDGRHVVITSSRGTDERYAVHTIDLRAALRSRRNQAANWQARPLITDFANEWSLIDGMGNRLWFVTDKDAPKKRVVMVDLSSRNRAWREIVPQRDATLDRASIVGDRLILNYLVDASSNAEMVSLSGQPVKRIALNDIGTASGFGGEPGVPETFYSFSSFNRPPTIYRLDLASGDTSVFAAPQLAFNPDDYVVEQRFYASKDGTRIPMFVIHRRGLDMTSGAPTLLYAYGGFNVSQLPGFSATRMAWLESGGVFVLANIRGGGEYGKAWHDGGRLANKPNTFDDFIAAGEYLVAQGIAPRGGLAIEGRSNGGLLIGAVANQRPDLFAAGHAAVGVMDMLRFDRFTAGRYWVDDYGYPDREADFGVLRAYSPYHNIRAGAPYPALMISTADTDDRVVPGHSFKYVSALQQAGLGPRPQLIRIETRAGHGSGKPTDKVIAEFADIYSFLAHWTGLKLEP